MRLYEFISGIKENVRTPELIQSIKDSFDKGILLKDIASQLGISREKVSNILLTHYGEREKRVENYTPEEIEIVKSLWNRGLENGEIISQSGFSPAKVKGILGKHYGERERRRKEWTPERIELLKKLYDQGLEFRKIGSELGISKGAVGDALNDYYLDRNPRNKSYDSNQRIEMGRLYAAGISITEIGRVFKSDGSTVLKMIKKLPNFEKLKQQRLAIIDAAKEAERLAQATTNIYRPGSIGNLHSKGSNMKGVRATKNKKHF